MPQPVFYREKNILFDDVTISGNDFESSDTLRVEDSSALVVSIKNEGTADNCNLRFRGNVESDNEIGTFNLIENVDLTVDPNNRRLFIVDARLISFFKLDIANEKNNDVSIVKGRAFSVEDKDLKLGEVRDY